MSSPSSSSKNPAPLPPTAIQGNVLATGLPCSTPPYVDYYQSHPNGSADQTKPDVCSDVETDKPGAVLVDASQDVLEAKQAARDDFITGLCKSGGPCCEACWCYHCQVSRQYNMLTHKRRGLHCGVCCLLCCVDWWTCLSLGKACQCYLRQRLRRRYRLKAGGCGDCCAVFWCSCCALSQTHWEMAMRGDDPGATCSCGGVNMPAQMR